LRLPLTPIVREGKRSPASTGKSRACANALGSRIDHSEKGRESDKPKRLADNGVGLVSLKGIERSFWLGGLTQKKKQRRRRGKGVTSREKSRPGRMGPPQKSVSPTVSEVFNTCSAMLNCKGDLEIRRRRESPEAKASPDTGKLGV